MAYDPDDFLRQVDITPKGGSIILDEGGEAWFNRDFQTSTNKALAKASMQIRERNLNILIAVPLIWYLDKIAIFRHRCWAVIEARGIERGFSEIYRPKFKKYGREDVPYWDMKAVHRFPELPAKFFNEYRKLKRERAGQRLARYIDDIGRQRNRYANQDHSRRLEEIRGEVLKNPSLYMNQRGTFDWTLIMYHQKTGEGKGKSIARVLNQELRAGSISISQTTDGK